MELGIPKGKAIGNLLATLLDLVHQNPQWNQKQFLLEKAKELM
jgi:hypothetical protein